MCILFFYYIYIQGDQKVSAHLMTHTHTHTHTVVSQTSWNSQI
jgi:hypothetical protein